MPTRPALKWRIAAAAAGLAAALLAGCNTTASAPDDGPERPTTLRFRLEPENSLAGAQVSPGVEITVFDNFGDTSFSSTAVIRLSIALGTGSPAAKLHGDTVVAAVNGTADFYNLVIDSAGTGYQLLASSQGLGSALSVPFDVARP